jgi:septal ring factor EnvC (AmiA/AmiB activator)
MSENPVKFDIGGSDDNSELEMLLQQIIDMDVRAQNMTNAAENIKKASEQTIAERKKEMIEQYNQRAEQRIALIEQQEKENAEKALADEINKIEAAKEQLCRRYEENRLKWVDEIVRRTVSI